MERPCSGIRERQRGRAILYAAHGQRSFHSRWNRMHQRHWLLQRRQPRPRGFLPGGETSPNQARGLSVDSSAPELIHDVQGPLPFQSHPGVSHRSALLSFAAAQRILRLFWKEEDIPCPARSAIGANPPASALPKAKKSARSAVAPSAKSPLTARPIVRISSPPTATKTAISAPCPRILHCSMKKSRRISSTLTSNSWPRWPSPSPSSALSSPLPGTPTSSPLSSRLPKPTKR